MADSRNEDLLENILGESNEYGEPQSRNEAILQNILGEQNELLPPVSRIEELLLQLKDAMPSGEIAITENGVYDIAQYKNASVEVPQGVFPSGDLLITENGWYRVVEYEGVSVNIASGGNGTIPFSNIFECITSSMEVTKNA